MAIDRVKTKANAEKALKAGKIPEAIRELQKLADDNPRDIQVLNQIGQLHLRQGNREMAVPCFLKVADLFSKSGFFTKAVASLKIVTREAPENLSAWEMLASLSEQQGFTREALGAYEKVAELSVRTGNLGGVIEVQKKLLELEPDNLKIQVQLGDNLIKAGRKEEGVKHYLKAGGKLIAQGLVKEGARMYERALQLDPHNFGALEAAVKTQLAHQQGDVALQLLDSLLERAPGAEGMLLLKADVLTETRQFAAAEEVCRQACAAHTDSPGAMFRLVRAFVMQKKIDEASSAIGAWLKATGGTRATEAESLYEEILRFSTGHVPSLRGLVDVARLSGKRERLANVLAALADNAAAQGPFEVAREALQELVSFDPNNLQLAEKLHAVERKMGLATHPGGQAPAVPQPPGSDALKPPPAAPPEDLEVIVEETGEAEIEIEMDDLRIEPVDVTASFSKSASPPAGPVGAEVSEAPEEEEEISLEKPTDVQTPPPLTAREADDIRDHLTEAEVFLKYGLVEKAIAELQGILKKVPDHIHAHQKLIAVFRNQKKTDKVIRQMLKLAAVFAQQGDEEKSAQLVEEARALDPSHKALLDFERASGASAITIDVEGLEKSTKAAEPKAPAPAPSKPSIELDLEPLVSVSQSPAESEEILLPTEEEVPAAGIPLGELRAVQEEDLAPVAEALGVPAIDENLELDVEEAFKDQPATSAAELAEHLEEAEFYLNQELFGEAQRALHVLEENWPDEPRVKRFAEKLHRAAPATAEAAQPPESPDELPMVVSGPLAEEPRILLEDEPIFEASRAEAHDSGDEAVPDGKELSFEEPVVAEPLLDEPAQPAGAQPEKAGAADTGTASRGRARMKVSVKDILPEETEPKAEEGLFKENEYYDLASELGAALEGLQAPEESLFEEEAKSPEEMSFEEVFEEFKKGVEKKVSEEDYATHYNLGIAYKEMELLDEAIGEFQLAARSPQFFVECCSMLGICFRQKGLTELAEKWYRKGIAAPGFADEVYVGLKYDLADTLAEQGRGEEANDLFKEVYAIQASYRDVKDRIKQMD